LPAVDTRHHEVEDDEMWLVLVHDAERDMSVRGGAHVISLMAQSERDEVGDALFVVDDEDAGRPTHCFEYMRRFATTPPRDDPKMGLLSAFSAASTLDE
jgi:hypothetical protein